MANFWIIVQTMKKQGSHVITNEPKAHTLRQSHIITHSSKKEARKRKEQKVLLSNSQLLLFFSKNGQGLTYINKFQYHWHACKKKSYCTIY